MLILLISMLVYTISCHRDLCRLYLLICALYDYKLMLLFKTNLSNVKIVYAF